ncbi:MAG: type II secretion system protein [Vulcanimicrobiota bacterium]
MIVIAFISILAYIIIPDITRARAQAQFNACVQNLKGMHATAHMYLADQISDDISRLPECPTLGIVYCGHVHFLNGTSYHICIQCSGNGCPCPPPHAAVYPAGVGNSCLGIHEDPEWSGVYWCLNRILGNN